MSNRNAQQKNVIDNMKVPVVFSKKFSEDNFIALISREISTKSATIIITSTGASMPIWPMVLIIWLQGLKCMQTAQ
jgi:hypothetical protein